MLLHKACLDKKNELPTPFSTYMIELIGTCKMVSSSQKLEITRKFYNGFVTVKAIMIKV